MGIAQLEEQIESGNFQAVKEILMANPMLANTNTSHQISPLLLACYYKKQEIADLLLEFTHDLTLFEACAVGKFDAATFLIFQNPASINAFSEDGFSPLGLACYFGHEDLARFLVLKGADVNLASKNGFNVFPSEKH